MTNRFDVTKRSVKDVFGAHLLEGAEYDIESGWDIPYVDTSDILELPDHLTAYSKINADEDKEHAYLHFYEYDYIFDGRMGIWFAMLFQTFFKKGFRYSKLDGFIAMITPDYSVYGDMPRIMQMWNVFRSRVVGYYWIVRGYNVVVNVHWTDRRSYDYCFAGLRHNPVIAVSTLGCLRSTAERELFLPGLQELINRIHPETIILYGSLDEEVKNLLECNHQHYLFFPSEISKSHGGTR